MGNRYDVIYGYRYRKLHTRSAPFRNSIEIVWKSKNCIMLQTANFRNQSTAISWNEVDQMKKDWMIQLDHIEAMEVAHN